MKLALACQPALPPADAISADQFLLSSVIRDPSTGYLRISQGSGLALSLGRFHLAPVSESNDTQTTVVRRLTGGRALVAGSGILSISLVLPHRSALSGDDRLSLRPHQIPNRLVRPLLRFLRAVGIDPHYPGRDLVFATGRAIAALAFEEAPSGALLFEIAIALDRPLSDILNLLDALDHDGRVKGQLLLPEHTVTVNALTGTPISFDLLCRLLESAYRDEFGVEVAQVPDLPESAFRQRIDDPRRGADQPPPSEQIRCGTVATEIGIAETFVRCSAAGTIEDLWLVGDLLANSAAIAEAEIRLRGCPLDYAAIHAVLDAVFSQPGNFLLGISTSALAQTIASVR